jgi:phosphoribosyl-ATP pyrophosphohydrolase
MLAVILMFGTLIVVLHLMAPVSLKSMTTPQRPIDELEQTIAERADSPTERSYTSQLLAGGVEKIGAKVVEEAAEVVEAAAESGEVGRQHFICEVGDLVYHLLVMLRHRGCSLADVEAELARRSGVSGLEEKASRKEGSVVRVQGSAQTPITEP